MRKSQYEPKQYIQALKLMQQAAKLRLQAAEIEKKGLQLMTEKTGSAKVHAAVTKRMNKISSL
jgi:hypothetical protein